MPGSLDVLKDCVIFVDVRTEDGEDAAALFVDMLRGLGARILAKPGKSCTHLVYKAGLPSTITKYKLLPEPRPLPVSIGWVVECVEKRAHVEETRFLVNLDEIGIAGGAQVCIFKVLRLVKNDHVCIWFQLRRSMQPKQMRSLTLGQLDSGEPADISVRADSSFTSEDPSTSGLDFLDISMPSFMSPFSGMNHILANLSPPARNADNNLPPLERARQRSLRLSRE
ncbi:hypothetical protein K439DRAFT_1350517 [Ramaria rubella]|nr:hypothetical protein K439DRAFT_1350517 [Ramaria rubella]